MASYVDLTLDTTPPGGVAVEIDGGAAYATALDVVLGISTTDPDTTGYTVKIYGDVDDAHAPAEYRALEADAPWVNFAALKNVRLSAGDGGKTVRVKVRDDVWNVSAETTDAIILDTTVPVVTVTVDVDPDKISEVAGKDEATFTWESNSAYQAYKVKVVPATDSLNGAGTQIPNAAGSINVSGGAGAAATPVVTTIDGTDLKNADPGDGTKHVKVFVQDLAGNWSV